jgi:hypothetical protein
MLLSIISLAQKRDVQAYRGRQEGGGDGIKLRRASRSATNTSASLEAKPKRV